MTPMPDLQSLIDSVRTDAASAEPLAQLAQAAESLSEIEQVSDAMLDYFVERCRAEGCSWSQISGVLGVTKQAAHKRFAGGPPTFERFTELARAALKDATEIARALGHATVEPNDLLRALFAPEQALAAQVLHGLGLTPDDVPEDRGDATVDPDGTMGFAKESIGVLRQALEEALQLGHNYIGTEHLLLALALHCTGGIDRLDYGDVRSRVQDRIAAIQALRKAAKPRD
jgi:hypothetical protein